MKKKSSFVSVLAWIIIGLSGYYLIGNIVFIVLLHTILPINIIENIQLCGGLTIQILNFLLSNIEIVSLVNLVYFLLSMISAIVLLLRKEWGRKAVIIVLFLTIIISFFGAFSTSAFIDISQDSFFQGKTPPSFIFSDGYLLFVKILNFISSFLIAGFLGWALYKLLFDENIKKEFLPDISKK